MNATADELRHYLDRERIRDCIARLARGEDRRDAALLCSCWWPDAQCDFGVFAGDFAAYLAWVVPGSPAIVLTQHFLGQSLIELQDGVARVETPVMSYHRVDAGAEHRDLTIGGRYLDRFAQRDGQWRIAERTMLYDWSQDFGVAADLANGLMGTPFSAPHFVGRTQNDHSVAFFAEGRN